LRVVPRIDIPWISALAYEVWEAAIKLLHLPQHARLNGKYGDRPNPLFSRLAALLSFPARTNLDRIVAELASIGSRPYCLAFDGGVFSCSNLDRGQVGEVSARIGH
jgi:hypothetical protein